MSDNMANVRTYTVMTISTTTRVDNIFWCQAVGFYRFAPASSQSNWIDNARLEPFEIQSSHNWQDYY